MGLFNKKTQNENTSERDRLTARYNGSRNNILLVVAFTLINTFLLFTGSETYFLFSAAIPYYMTLFGLLYTGRMPAEWYEGVENFQPDPDAILYIYLAIAVIIVAFYALTWFLSKKHGYGWLVFALIIFVIDTFAMFYFSGFSSDMIIDFVFHIWVIVSLFSGILAALKLKDLPLEEEYTVEVGQNYSYIPQPAEMPVENVEPYAPVEENAVETETTLNN